MYNLIVQAVSVNLQKKAWYLIFMKFWSDLTSL